MKDKFLNLLNLLLVADVFFVFAIFGWFVIAVAGRSTGVNLGFDLWYSLWQPVFNPALGILMSGAILSGIINQVSKRLNPK